MGSVARRSEKGYGIAKSACLLARRAKLRGIFNTNNFLLFRICLCPSPCFIHMKKNGVMILVWTGHQLEAYSKDKVAPWPCRNALKEWRCLGRLLAIILFFFKFVRSGFPYPSSFFDMMVRIGQSRKTIIREGHSLREPRTRLLYQFGIILIIFVLLYFSCSSNRCGSLCWPCCVLGCSLLWPGDLLLICFIR